MSAYIGPERRKGERRDPQSFVHRELRNLPERRLNSDRRQGALAGVIVGLTAKEMEQLAVAWRLLDTKGICTPFVNPKEVL